MTDLTPAETLAYLSEPGKDAIVATVNPGGQPHAVPVWYTVDGGEVVFSTGFGGVKGRNLKSNPKIAVCVSQPEGPIMFVSIQGDAVEVTAIEEKRRLVAQIMGKYGESSAPEGDLSDTFVVRVKARKTVAVRY